MREAKAALEFIIPGGGRDPPRTTLSQLSFHVFRHGDVLPLILNNPAVVPGPSVRRAVPHTLPRIQEHKLLLSPALHYSPFAEVQQGNSYLLRSSPSRPAVKSPKPSLRHGEPRHKALWT
ncbi:hypothetical protein GN956_G9957 [Arapaima gigas]